MYQRVGNVRCLRGIGRMGVRGVCGMSGGWGCEAEQSRVHNYRQIP